MSNTARSRKKSEKDAKLRSLKKRNRQEVERKKAREGKPFYTGLLSRVSSCETIFGSLMSYQTSMDFRIGIACPEIYCGGFRYARPDNTNRDRHNNLCSRHGEKHTPNHDIMGGTPDGFNVVEVDLMEYQNVYFYISKGRVALAGLTHDHARKKIWKGDINNLMLRDATYGMRCYIGSYGSLEEINAGLRLLYNRVHMRRAYGNNIPVSFWDGIICVGDNMELKDIFSRDTNLVKKMRKTDNEKAKKNNLWDIMTIFPATGSVILTDFDGGHHHNAKAAKNDCDKLAAFIEVPRQRLREAGSFELDYTAKDFENVGIHTDFISYIKNPFSNDVLHDAHYIQRLRNLDTQYENVILEQYNMWFRDTMKYLIDNHTNFYNEVEKILKEGETLRTKMPAYLNRVSKNFSPAFAGKKGFTKLRHCFIVANEHGIYTEAEIKESIRCLAKIKENNDNRPNWLHCAPDEAPISPNQEWTTDYIIHYLKENYGIIIPVRKKTAGSGAEG